MEDFKEIGESYQQPIITVIPPTADPLVMYLVVRESLGMSIGKTAAQVAHAAQRLQQRYQELHDEAESYLPPLHDCHESDFLNIPKDILEKIDIFSKWSRAEVRKIVLKANEKEWFKLKSILWSTTALEYNLVIDAGFTELAPHTETVIGFWPVYKSKVPLVIKRLQLL